MKYTCPICKREVDDSLPTIPFCSKRCKMIDLGSWLDGNYRVADESQPGDNQNEFDKLKDEQPTDEE